VTEAEADKIMATLDPLAAMAESNAAQLDLLLRNVETSNEWLQKMIAETAAAAGLYRDNAKEIVEDDVPEPPADPITKPGDLWLLGEHRLLCGDSTKAEDVERLYDGVSVGCVLTDPPYGIALDTEWADGGGRDYKAVIGDDKPFDATKLRSALSKVDEQFWFGANYYRRTLTESDLDGSWLVWDKRNEATDSVIGSGFELCWSAVKHKQDVLRVLWTNYTSHTNEGHGRAHPTEKPIRLLAEILTRWASESCIVADPFLGSGTTLIAAEQTGRICYGMEISPQYCDVIVKRWETLTGKKAELDVRGR